MARPFTRHSPHYCVWQDLVSQSSFLWFGGCLLEPPTLPFKVRVREVRRELSCSRQWIFPVLGFLEMCSWFETREGSESGWCHRMHTPALVAVATPLSHQTAHALLRKACRMPGNTTGLDITVGNDGMWEIQILFRFLGFLLWISVPFLLCKLQRPLAIVQRTFRLLGSRVPAGTLFPVKKRILMTCHN